VTTGTVVCAVLVLALEACTRRPATRVAPPDPAAVFGRDGVPDRLEATIETDLGTIHCVLDPRHAPRSAALFVGLARGSASFVDTRTGATARRPFYDALVFHRRIPSVLVQSGCPLGNGTGTPGYRIALESSPDDAERLARPGALLLARYTPPPGRVDQSPPPPGDVIGSQFVIGLVAMDHLAGEVPVLGACGDLDVVRAIAAVPRGAVPPTVRRVTVR
jgi:peptidyl-prolyl cis-trans isomerase A (cyclophilin A)